MSCTYIYVYLHVVFVKHVCSFLDRLTQSEIGTVSIFTGISIMYIERI